MALAGLVMASCQIQRPGIDASAPFEVPGAYVESERTSSPPSPITFVGRWWEAFEDPALNALIEESFENNLDVKAAVYGLRQLDALVLSASASGGPSVGLGAGAGRVRQRFITDPVTTDIYKLSLSAGYEIDLFRKIKSLEQAARFDREATAGEIRALYISLSAEVAEHYFISIQKHRELELAVLTAASLEETLRAAELRHRNGLGDSAGVYAAQKALAKARAGVPARDASLKGTLYALSTLAGRYPDGDIVGKAAELPDAPDTMEPGFPAGIISSRPDVMAALLKVAAADRRVAAAVAGRYPSINLSAGVEGAGDEIRTVLDSPNILWNAMLSAAAPLLDAGRRKAEVSRTRAAVHEALARYHQSILGALRDVELALSANASAQRALDEALRRHSAVVASYGLIQRRYKEGLADHPSVLTAQRELYESRGALVAARREVLSARVGLARALGGGEKGEVTGFAGDELKGRLTSISTERETNDGP